MNKRKYFTYNTLLVAAIASCLVFTSCKKWLDVKPEDRFTEEMIFKDEKGFSEALNGVYIKMGETSLYGRNLSFSTLDLFAQRYYSTSSGSPWYSYVAYDYGASSVKNNLEQIWESMYLGIINLNQYLVNVEKFKSNITAQQAAFYKGQALGLRAFLHFDLLRMWGPVYNSSDSTKTSIPYYDKVTTEVVPFQPANEVMNRIMKDLREAEGLLANDPVTQDGYRNQNNLRMNLYSIKGLMARVLQYREDKSGAFAKAKEVIEQQSKFPWVTYTAATVRDYPDRIFGTEVLFGIYSRSMYEQYDNLFEPELNEASLLSTGPSVLLETVYEKNLADYRNTQHWLQSASGAPYKTLYKFQDVRDIRFYAFRYVVPAIRMSEMYYIAAESNPDPAEGLKLLDSVRTHRNITTALTDPTKLEAEIAKEYQKEFYAEGQLWYYYKRKKFTLINAANNKAGVAVTLPNYVFPYPDSEISVR